MLSFFFEADLFRVITFSATSTSTARNAAILNGGTSFLCFMEELNLGRQMNGVRAADVNNDNLALHNSDSFSLSHDINIQTNW